LQVLENNAAGSINIGETTNKPISRNVDANGGNLDVTVEVETVEINNGRRPGSNVDLVGSNGNSAKHFISVLFSYTTFYFKYFGRLSKILPLRLTMSIKSPIYRYHAALTLIEAISTQLWKSKRLQLIKQRVMQ
jgi:hypothetical protein